MDQLHIIVNLVAGTTNMKPDSLDQNIIYLCTQFSHRFGIKMASQFKANGIDITAEQFSILVVLWYKDGISQKEISESLDRDKTTITRVLGNMKRNKLIKQVTDTGDNRSNLIYLTAKGKEIQKKGVKVSGELYTTILKNIPSSQLPVAVEVLRNMLDACK